MSLQENPGEGLAFDILKNGEKTGIRFRAVPTGHEFTSLLLAVLNADGKGKNLPDEFVTKRLKSLKGDIRLTTYMSLTCTNCPDVVQTLNAMAMINPHITHEAVDGAIYKEERRRSTCKAYRRFCRWRTAACRPGNFGELLAKLEARYGVETRGEEQTVRSTM